MEAKNSGIIRQVKTSLIVVFEIVDIKLISFYLGFKVNQDHEKKTIKLSKLVYIDKILSKFYLTQANTSNRLMRKSSLIFNKGKVTTAKQKHYQEMTSLIMCSMIETRPVITFAISVMSCFAKNLFHQYNKTIKTIFQYLKIPRKTRITYGGEKEGDLIIKG